MKPSGDIFDKASKAFTILERHRENNCPHCTALLKEIFDNKEGKFQDD